MLTGEYKLAGIKEKEDILKRITKYEDELAKEIGGDVVLIAYQRDERVKD